MRWLLLTACLLLSGQASAEPKEPPARFDRPHPDMQIVERDYRAVDPACRRMFRSGYFPAATDKHRVTGCAMIGDGQAPCWIIVPRPGERVIPEAHRGKIVRHERAHCNGWPSSHPG